MPNNLAEFASLPGMDGSKCRVLHVDIYLPEGDRPEPDAIEAMVVNLEGLAKRRDYDGQHAEAEYRFIVHGQRVFALAWIWPAEGAQQ